MTRLTGSGAGRAISCPASLALPSVETETHELAIRGTAGHGFLCDVPQIGVDEALEKVPDEWREVCEEIDLDSLPLDATEWVAELALAYDVATDTARELCRGKGRPNYDDFDLGPYEVPMTLDVVGLGDDFVAVSDYKTGYVEPPVPAENEQLKLGGLACARLFQRDRARLEIIRIRKNGGVWRPPIAWLDGWDLEDVAADHRALSVRVIHARKLVADGVTPPTSPGPHCSYCPAATSCPSQTALIRQAAKALEIEDCDSYLADLEPERVAQIYTQHKAIVKLLGHLGRSLEKYAKRRSLPLADGMVYGQRERRGNLELDGSVVYKVLAEDPRYGHEAAAQAVEMKASQSRIEDVVRPHKDGRKVTIKMLKQEVLDKVDELGGSRRPLVRRVEEFAPPKEIAECEKGPTT